MNVQGAILFRLGEALSVQELELPKLEMGQVLVKVLYSGVCRSQIMERDGLRGHDKWLPHLLGHEGTGIVVDVGPSVSKVKVGDSVVLGWLRGDGLEAPGAVYISGGVKINSGQVTTFSNYSIVSENRLYLKPDCLPFDLCPLLGCALPTGAGMIINNSDISHSDWIAVIGLGGVGLSALLALTALNFKNLIVVEPSLDKLKIAKRLGVKYCFSATDDATCSEIKEITSGGLNYCFEAAGTVETIEFGFSTLHPSSGSLVFASHPAKGKKISIDPHELICGKRIIGSWGGGTNPEKDILKLSMILKRHEDLLRSMVGEVYSLSDVNQALDDLSAGTSFRPILKMQHENE